MKDADGDASSLNLDEPECMEVEDTPTQEEAPIPVCNVTLEQIVQFGTELCEFEKTLRDPDGKLRKIRFVSFSAPRDSRPVQKSIPEHLSLRLLQRTVITIQSLAERVCSSCLSRPDSESHVIPSVSYGA